MEQPDAGEPQPERQSSLVRMSSLGRLHRASTRQAIVHSMLDGKQGGEDDTLALLSKVRARFDRCAPPEACTAGTDAIATGPRTCFAASTAGARPCRPPPARSDRAGAQLLGAQLPSTCRIATFAGPVSR